MRRGLGWMLALALLVGGVAACGDDDDGGDAAATEEGGAGGGEGGDEGSGNPAIQAYCDDVQELVDASEELAGDPTNAELQAEVQQLTTDLATEAGNVTGGLAEFSDEEIEQFEACQADFNGVGG